MTPPPLDVERHELPGGVIVGVAEADPDDLDAAPVLDAEAFDVLLTTADDPPRPWVAAPLEPLVDAAVASPGAAQALVQVLRATEDLPVADAIVVESLAYSMLQHGERFKAWLADRPSRAERARTTDPVGLHRDGDHLEIVLHRPEVHNALDAAMRDALCEAFDLVDADSSIEHVVLRGGGPSFCSGGDLDEFGTATDAVEAHRVRVARSVGGRVHHSAERVTACLHGACIGAGIEIAAFAGTVVADPATSIRLPELAMGLIPGAGGTVSLPRRIGRHRTAYLALTGAPLDADTAHRWGLVDRLTDRPSPDLVPESRQS